ncbi:unknown protein [Cronobacter turicensis z3032]|uniref:Uncharacterized protein n=1 Tax=Cronobacter turicensis (strain DSM 18703 / CCUG 55852 / LMG 23827 / z3032) TaxID=693216 RepID=C9XZK4_CROTZ|nr:unknown protein [Cronobacter turicensis z3032]
MGFPWEIRHFFTKISTEKVNKSGLLPLPLFITPHIFVSYSNVIPVRTR